MDNVVVNKIEVIRRCIHRIREEYQDNPVNLSVLTKQDSIVLNIQRACEACIDLAMHVVAKFQLGLPQSSRDAFDLLYKEQLISESLQTKMKSMVGFRNIAVHDYQAILLDVVQAIVEKHLDDLLLFAEAVLQI